MLTCDACLKDFEPSVIHHILRFKEPEFANTTFHFCCQKCQREFQEEGERIIALTFQKGGIV